VIGTPLLMTDAIDARPIGRAQLRRASGRVRPRERSGVGRLGGVAPLDIASFMQRRNVLATVLTLLLGCSTDAAPDQSAPARAPSHTNRIVVPRSASIGSPRGVTVDAAGNVYFTSNLNDVFKLAPIGEITLVAGSSQAGFSGDGGPATSAKLNLVGFSVASGLVVDAGGNLYIADTLNHRIRKVSRAGVITTIAGTGTRAFSGDGGPALNAQLSDPAALAFDVAGNLYVSDWDNNRIRKIALDGIITTVAGSGKRGYSGDGGPALGASMDEPTGIAVDGNGNLYIADTHNFCVRKVSRDGVITTVVIRSVAAGTGPWPVRTQLGYTYGVAVDGAGTLYVTDSDGIRKLSPAGELTTVAKGGPAFSGDGGAASSSTVYEPVAAAVDRAGNVFIADKGNYRIRRIGANGVIATVAGTGFSPEFAGDGGPALNARLNLCSGCQDHASDLAMDAAGNLYIADTGNHRVRRISANGVITTLAGNGTMGYSGDGGPAIRAQLSLPTSIAIDRTGNLFIAESYGSHVRKVAPDGTIKTVLDTGGLAGLAVDGAGNLYLAENYMHRVRKFSADGTVTTIAGAEGRGVTGDGVPAVNARLTMPMSVGVDSAGRVYVSDSGRIRKIASNGIITTIADATNSAFSNFARIALDRAGNLFIAEPYNYRVRKVDTNGAITTILGRGFAGAAPGSVWAGVEVQPTGIVVDGTGTVYIADSAGRWRDQNNRPRATGWQEVCLSADCILKIAPDGTVTKVAGGGPSNVPRGRPETRSVGPGRAGTRSPSPRRPSASASWLNAMSAHVRADRLAASPSCGNALLSARSTCWVSACRISRSSCSSAGTCTTMGPSSAKLPRARPGFVVLVEIAELCVVDVLFDRAPTAARVSPDDVRATVGIGRHPHVVTEEPGLESVVCRHNIRHRRGRDARIGRPGARCRRLEDLGERDVVAAGRLTPAVRTVVVADPELASVWCYGPPCLPLSCRTELGGWGDVERGAPGRPAVGRGSVEDVVVAGSGQPEVAARAAVPEVRPHEIQVAQKVHR
jgi:sugar lactone lactonase YvrE